MATCRDCIHKKPCNRLRNREFYDEQGAEIFCKDFKDESLFLKLPCQKGAMLNRNGEKCIADHWNIILTAFNEDNHVRLFDIKEAEAELQKRGKENA